MHKIKIEFRKNKKVAQWGQNQDQLKMKNLIIHEPKQVIKRRSEEWIIQEKNLKD